MKTKTIVLVVLGLFCCIAPLLAQKQLDSIIRASSNKIFDQPNNAIEIGQEVFGKATDPRTKINALMLISNAHLSKRENSKSLEYALKARAYLPEIKSIRSQFSVLNIIGMQHQQLGIYNKAIEYLDEALLLSKEIHPDSLAPLLAFNYTIRGFIYREQMSCETALGYFDKAETQFKKSETNKRIIANLSTLTYNKGNCYLQLSQIDSARANFNMSMDYAKDIGANSLYAFAKKGLSEVYTAEGNYQRAIIELKEAEEASDKVGDLILNQGIYKNLSDNYLAINNKELYNEYFNRYSIIQEKTSEKERITINNSIQDLIQESNRQNSEELSKLKTIQWILISLIALLIIFFIKTILKSRKDFKNATIKLRSLKE